MDLNCPITGEMMIDPVICVDGHTYERAAILNWLSSHNTSPMTGLPLASKNLIPNIALRNIASDGFNNIVEQKSTDVIDRAGQPELKTRIMNGQTVLSVTAPMYNVVPSHHVICVVDVSGSMATVCTEGFTRLDLVKHSLKLTIKSLTANDRLTIIPFSYSARYLCHDMYMTDANKTIVTDLVMCMVSAGGTNIWAGLQHAIDSVSGNSSIILLTDGQPTMTPESIIQHLTNYNKTSATISTIGFSYEVNVDLLTKISNIGHGSYLHIPDITMVGTVFVNYLANTLSSCGNYRINNESHSFLYGQTRTFVLPLYDTIRIDAPDGSFQTYSVIDTLNIEEASKIYDYNKFTVLLNKLVQAANTTVLGQPMNESVRVLLSDLFDVVRIYKDLSDDLSHNDLHKGQISKALNNYTSWGMFYLPMLANAHTRQLRCNFKESSIRDFGSEMSKALCVNFDETYSTMDAIASYKTNLQNLAVFNNADGGCFDGNGHVIVMKSINNTLVKDVCKVEDLTVGDYVLTGKRNVYAKVKCVVVQDVKDLLVYQYLDMNITAWHPIRLVNTDDWQFPANLNGSSKLYTGKIYNLVLENEHTIIISGYEVLCLGHNITKGLAYHSYFGTNLVIDDLSKVIGWDTGYIDISNYKFVRSAESNLIVGLEKVKDTIIELV
jgi:hypothetical protein